MTSQYLPGKEHFEALRRQHNVVPVWTEVIADLETPVSTYMKLVQGAEPDSVSFLLESVEHGQRWGR
ncbi:MAG TPA: anthranilate synthase component I, partial [Actinomycetota bacterium]|nr:anthranilate synthase component I [Actinomycetota bacterium]